MMDNYKRTMELIDTAYNSAGKSTEQFNKYQDTLEYKLNKLQNTWEQFRTDFFNSDFFKNAVDGLNEILDRIKDLSGKELLGLGAAFVVLGKTLIPNLISGMQKGISGIRSLISKGVSKVVSSVGKPAINLEVKIKTRELEILKQKQQELIDKKITFEVEEEQALKDLEKIQKKMNELQAQAGEGVTITFDEAAGQAGVEEGAAEAAKNAEELQTSQTEIQGAQSILNERVADKQRMLEQEQIIRSLAEHRANLQPGEACPLCGAHEHPAIAHYAQLDSSTTRGELDRLKQAQKQGDTTLRECDVQLAAAQTQARNLHTREQQLIEEGRANQSAWDELRAQLQHGDPLQAKDWELADRLAQALTRFQGSSRPASAPPADDVVDAEFQEVGKE